LLAAEQKMARWAVVCVLAYPTFAVYGWLYYWSLVPVYQRWWRSFRAAIDNIGTPGYVAPQPPSLFGGGGAGFHRVLGVADGLGELAVLVLFVLFLIWQYRAAELARSLGYPAQWSPGWGVGVWFIPIVNLWMPYQAIRDTLPASHPVRTWLWRVWLMALLAGCSGIVGIALLLAAEPIGLAFLGVGAVMILTFGWLGRRLVIAIGEDHARSVNRDAAA
jgi:Domain of unknown function (DUF4328)